MQKYSFYHSGVAFLQENSYFTIVFTWIYFYFHIDSALRFLAKLEKKNTFLSLLRNFSAYVSIVFCSF